MDASTALELLRARIFFSSTASAASSAKALADARRLLPSAEKALASDAERAALGAAVYDASGLAALECGDGDAALTFFLSALRLSGDGEETRALRARRLLNAGAALGRLARHSEARDFALAAADTVLDARSDEEEAAKLGPVAFFNAAAASEFLGELGFARALYVRGAAVIEPASELEAAFTLAISEVEGAIECAANEERLAFLADARDAAGAFAKDVAISSSSFAPAISADTSSRLAEPALEHRFLGTAGLRGDHRPAYPRALEQNMRVLGIGQPKVEKPRPKIVRRARPPRSSVFESGTLASSRDDDDVKLSDSHTALTLLGERGLAASPLAVSPRATINMNAAGKALALACRPDFISLVPSPRPSMRADAELRLSSVQRAAPSAHEHAAADLSPFRVDTLSVKVDAASAASAAGGSALQLTPFRAIGTTPVVAVTQNMQVLEKGSLSDDLSILARCQERLREAFAAVERNVLRPRT
jgi:hypothetical protein